MTTTATTRITPIITKTTNTSDSCVGNSVEFCREEDKRVVISGVKDVVKGVVVSIRLKHCFSYAINLFSYLH